MGLLWASEFFNQFGWYSLIIFIMNRYALAQGASACAVDIEESREPMLGLRPIQRRVMSVSQPYQKEGK
jgi:hypothetical protein